MSLLSWSLYLLHIIYLPLDAAVKNNNDNDNNDNSRLQMATRSDINQETMFNENMFRQVVALSS